MYGDTIVIEPVTRLVPETALGELEVIALMPTAEVPNDTIITLIHVVVVLVGFCIVELSVLETSTGRELTRLVLLYGTMPLDTTCATLFAIRIADPFWNVKPEQLLVLEQISEQDARSLVAKLEVMLMLAGKNVLHRIS